MFDFGNVIGFFDYSLIFGRFGRRLGKSGEELEALLYDRGALAICNEFERGRLTAKAFAREVMALAGLELSFEEFQADWEDIFTLNEPVARLLPALKQRGYTLLLGSNTNVLHAQFFRRKFRETVDHFDHLVFSYEIGEIKPEQPFFAACVAAVGVPADSCIFIDDMEVNVQGARTTGLLGVHYRQPGSLLTALKRLGVQVPGIKT
jgi:putative hydrolase of the HAD superfamily